LLIINKGLALVVVEVVREWKEDNKKKKKKSLMIIK